MLDATPLPLLAILLFIGLLAAGEAGREARRRFAASEDDALGHVLSGVLGLLALLIAFTFGLALERHEARRDLLVAEANAVGTADMHLRLLDAPQAVQLTALVRTYAETRLRYGEADALAKPRLQAQSARLRGQIQAETLTALQPIRLTPLASSIAAAVNETLDLGVAREAAHAARLPGAVLTVLVHYALVAAGVLGYALAGGRHQHRVLSGLLFVLLTLALGLILDLDRAQRGAIRIGQQPMASLVESLRAMPPASPASPPSPATPASPGAGGSSRP